MSICPFLAEADDVEITDVFAHDFDGGDAAIVLERWGAEIRFDIDVLWRIHSRHDQPCDAGSCWSHPTVPSPMKAIWLQPLPPPSKAPGLSDKVGATAGAGCR